MDELLYNGMRVISDVVCISISNNVAIMKHNNAVTNLIGAFHIMSDHH